MKNTIKKQKCAWCNEMENVDHMVRFYCKTSYGTIHEGLYHDDCIDLLQDMIRAIEKDKD